MSGINGANYLTLYEYSILAQAGITSATTITVNNGYYGTNSNPLQNTGIFVPARGVSPTINPPTGENNQTTSTTATNELGNVTSAAGTLVKDVITTAALLELNNHFLQLLAAL